jgi:glycerophosphoryl diester phosphodiesterase
MNKKIQLIAHRGASKYAPENTMASFQEAKLLEANYIECDIAVSKDRVPYIFHDDELNRTTNGRGKIKHLSWQELSQLDAGSWFSNEFSHLKIPNLVELLHWHQGWNGFINLEIKHIPPHQLVEHLNLILSIIQQFQGQERLILSSFQPELITQLHRLQSSLQRAMLVNRWSYPSVLFARDKGCAQLNIGNIIVTPQMVHKTHDVGLKLGVYTVNQRTLAQYLESIGVDAIFTDDPLIMQKN